MGRLRSWCVVTVPALVIALLSGPLAASSLWSAWDALQESSANGRLVVAVRDLVGDSPASPARLRQVDLLASLAAACGGLIVGGVSGAALAGVAAPLVATAIRNARSQRRARLIQRSLPTTLRGLSDALETGLPLEAAAAEVGQGGSAAGAAFASFAKARRSGASLGMALGSLAEGGGSWAQVAAAISLQRRCGGDLGAALRGIALVLDDSLRVEAEAQSATAQARMTATIVCALPVVGGSVAVAVWPSLVAQLSGSPISAALCFGAALTQVVCLVAIRRICEAAGR